MRVLVTGGAGFIGSHLVKALLEAGNYVRVLDDYSTGKPSNLAFGLQAMDEGRLKIIKGDICKFGDCGSACDNIDVVFHLAAKLSVIESFAFPIEYNEVNINGTIKMLEAAVQRGVKKFVFASSAAVYGDSPCAIQTECDSLYPVSPYAVNKLAGENYCRTYTEKHHLPTVAVRFFNVYGPKQDPNSPYSGVISQFIKNMAADISPIIFGDGEQGRDFVYVEDVVKGLICASNFAGDNFEVFNIGTGQEKSINRLVAVLNIIYNKKLPTIYQSARTGDLIHSCADIGKAKLVLGYKPRIAFGKGLSKTVQHYLSGEDENV